MRKKVPDFVRDLRVEDCVEFSVGKHIGKGKVERVLRAGCIRFKIPANTRPTRKWLMESMGIKTMTLNFTPNISYNHDTFVIADKTRRGYFLYWRPRTHHIVRVIKPSQINLFDDPHFLPPPVCEGETERLNIIVDVIHCLDVAEICLDRKDILTNPGMLRRANSEVAAASLKLKIGAQRLIGII